MKRSRFRGERSVRSQVTEEELEMTGGEETDFQSLHRDPPVTGENRWNGIPGVDSSFSSFSPTVVFSAVRRLVTLTVDPWFCVESFDLSGAYLGTEPRDRGVYV